MDGSEKTWIEEALQGLREAIAAFNPLSEQSWTALTKACRPRRLHKGEHLVALGDVPATFAYLHSGLIRAYALSGDGKEYNKIFFTEGMMPGAVVALLRKEPAEVALQALEDCLLVEIDHGLYRGLLTRHHDLLLYHCLYMEANWVIAKEPREVALAQQTAGERYAAFLREYPELEPRLSQGEVAAHLGITPTQLSRIRRTRKKDAPTRHM